MSWKKTSVFILLGLLALSFAMSAMSFVAAEANSEKTWNTILPSSTFLEKMLTYTFGNPANVATTDVANIVILIAMWLLIFITFGDIIATFSTFSPWVAWVSAALLTIIGSNIGLIKTIVYGLTALFVGLGAAAVYVGFGAAFVAFIAVNLGLGYFKNFIIRRKAMMHAATAKTGGAQLAGELEGLHRAGEALEKIK